MTERGPIRMMSRDRRGQMPFSLIAVVLIILSSLSAALVADLHNGSQGVGLTAEELDRMIEASEETLRHVQQIAWQALLLACSGDNLNESGMISRFQHELENRLSSRSPSSFSGLTFDINVSALRLSFLRLPLDQDLASGVHSGKYIPAYVGLAGTIGIRVSSDHGNLSRVYPVSDQGKVPWPLLTDRMKVFQGAVNGGLGDLSSLVNYLLESLGAYRTLQGWGSYINGDQGLAEIITSRDVVNAIDLGLIIYQIKHFRQVSPCYGISTDAFNGKEAWLFLENVLKGGGTIDPADLFLSIYGYDQLDWRKVFSQALNSAIERLSLRWMECLGLIKLLELTEKAGEAIFSLANDLIERTLNVDLAEERFIEWIEGTFDKAGIPDTLYRYLGAGAPDGTFYVDQREVTIITADGGRVQSSVSGFVDLDIPQTDVLSWEGWEDFHDQYKRGTLEILDAIRRHIAAVSEQVAMSMFLPPGALVLDPRDDVSFLEEIRGSLSNALQHKDTWIRAAMSAAEGTVTTSDPLAEATKAEFLENLDSILCRQQNFQSMITSAASQILSMAISDRGNESIPWQENLRNLEGLIATDSSWGVLPSIERTFEGQAQFLTNYFLEGLSHGTRSGTMKSWMADVVARTGDPYAGISVMLSEDVTLLLTEISHGIQMRGNRMNVTLPSSNSYSLLGADGRVYKETLTVKVVYPNEGDVSAWLSSSIIDPSHNRGSPGMDVQTHDTNILKSKAASYQSVWEIVVSGRISVTLAPGGDIQQVLPMTIHKDQELDAKMSVATLTGHALLGVEYINVNTLGQQVSDVIDRLLRPIQNGLGTIASGLRSVHRVLQETMHALIEIGGEALDALSRLLGSLVADVQDFLRSVASTLGSNIAKLLLGVLGERSIMLSYYGVGLTIRLKPTDLAYREVGVPASVSLSFKADDCRIDITTRLINGLGNISLLTNASLHAKDWTVSAVIDPFMDVFRHMVEVRGLVNGACVELVMPEVVGYRKVSFSLSDIPGVGALLSNIPLPIPGLKGSVNAGLYLKILEGRTDRVVINEYELNPASEDNGREWVEIFNPTTEAVDLTGWTIETGHGVQGRGVLNGVLMPRTRLVYQFPQQALDNIGEGFPFEETLVLRDERGRRVDNAPFSTDCWNDDRTWQRAKDGADRWEFRSGTKGSSNGQDVFSILDLDIVEQVYVSAITESLYQLSSGELTMEALATVVETALLSMLERLASNILNKEVVAGLFIEVAVAETSSTAKTGMRMDVMWRCGTLRDALHNLANSAKPLSASLGNPFQAYLEGLPSADGLWVSMSSFGAVGVPRMLAASGHSIEVRYQAVIAVDLGLLATVFGLKAPGWSMEAGAEISGVPAAAVPFFKGHHGVTLDIWVCKVTVKGISA